MADEDELPENLENLMSDIGFFLPEDATPDVMEVVKRGAEGRCCLCNSPLGKNTLIMVGVDGIRMAFCCGACLTDMQVTGWLSTMYDDMVTMIKFRGGQVDPDGPPKESDASGT